MKVQSAGAWHKGIPRAVVYHMKLTQIICLFIISVAINGCSRNLTCADFKTGNFYIPVPTSKKYLTITYYSMNKEPVEVTVDRDSSAVNTIVIRHEKSQTEWPDGIGKGTPENETIEWVDECNYRLKTDESKMELDEVDGEMNESGGLLIEKMSIEGRCMEYKATMTTSEGNKIVQYGLICKE